MSVKESMLFAQYKSRVESELLFLKNQITFHQDEIDNAELRIAMLNGDMQATRFYMEKENA
jgi:hypothetical protein